jgi:hypothetical protein
MLRARYFPPILLILLLLAVFAVSAAPAKDPASPVPNRITIGEFALKVIKLSADDPSANASLTAEEALSLLRKAGLHLKGSVDDPLTEGGRSSFALAVANGLLERINPPPSGFEACQGLPSVQECSSCCLGLQGSSKNSCGRACGQDRAAQAKASATEPTP